MAERLIDPDHLRTGVLETRQRLEANPPGGMIRPSVDSRLVGGVSVETRWEQFGRQFVLTSDEPAGRGGSATAPTAIRYFLTGIASCLGVWFAKGAALSGCELRGLSLRLEAALDMRREYDLAPTGAQEQLVAEADVDSPSPEAVVLTMADEAFRRCPLWNLVGRGVPVHRRIRHNGQLVFDTLP